MQHYRGIKLLNSVDMSSLKHSQAVDKLCDRLEKTGYVLIGAYHSSSKKIKGKCNNGHEIMITPNNFVNKETKCKHCFYLNRHANLVREFESIVKRHKLTQQEPFNFRKGVLQGLKEKYLFTCPYGKDHWLSPYKLVTAVLFQCYCGKCKTLGGKSK
ncbi:hypothetical protein [Paenibacillus sp. V4I7]|uniref:hypothetical protein n=1 Tax=Paenibacillus sp. V4I7 TaxID=3042307 RepID=UPI00277F0F6A|nr:hypothetical protein [Paenibacillus sp. V4I7]MDQ0898440.1 hypothetical protein [Paenibacillus sp. V4I7]